MWHSGSVVVTDRLVVCEIEPITPCVAWRILNHHEVRRISFLGETFFFPLEFINRRDRDNDGCSMGLRGEGVQAVCLQEGWNWET